MIKLKSYNCASDSLRPGQLDRLVSKIKDKTSNKKAEKKLSNFRKLILSIPMTEEERKHFVYICSDWALYCTSISGFNKFKVMQLLKYLIKERPKSNRLLGRCVSRFNRLNALKKGDLQ